MLGTRPKILSRARYCPFLAALVLLFGIARSHAAIVTGSLQDISLQELNTRITFAPANDVLLTSHGLNAGPPRTIATTNGLFSIPLEVGDYTVSLPLIPWRHPFTISVFETNGTINITNLLAPPHTYTYTNNQSYAVKATTADPGPGMLDAKIGVAGTLTKSLETNSGVVCVVLSNSAAASSLHVNAAKVTSWSTNGELSLLDSPLTLAADMLAPGKAIQIEAFGSFADPSVAFPNAIFRIRLGPTTVVVQTKGVTTANWHLGAALTVRSAGTNGVVVGTLAVFQDLAGADPFASDSQTATINTTTALTLSLTAAIENVTDSERVICEQLLIH